ncbi:hypothetical protein [Phenylobacterium immobile]|uniref:hypothetical protein n=1 Tax=Phenylobacterium immobile TaxID=21 RepID=UPI000B8A5AFF|nr:hypothetical protein [Phenylobacterium immobile]
MTVMTADRGANASVLAAAVAAMVGLAFLASVGLYLSAVNSQPNFTSKSPVIDRPAAKKPAVVKLASPAQALLARRQAPYADWMDRAIRANP